MNIHEYQAKQIFAEHNIPVPRGIVASTAQQAVSAAKRLGGEMWVIKAQIHAGGRGLAGGVKLAKSIKEVEKLAQEMLESTLVTHQTGPRGKTVLKVYIEEAADINEELYLGIVLDRAKEMPVVMASNEGGMDIEAVAESTPEKIAKVPIDPIIGFMGFHGRDLVFQLGITDKEEQKKFIKFVANLYDLYLEKDAELIEINPLIKTKSGEFLALDAKMNFDDSALLRHQEIEDMRDINEEDPNEREASNYGLSYISLDGEIGCVVNGAGLAMSTMDIINYEGGTVANFLDVGGKANPETVAKGFEIILRNPKVKAIFVNIFGGIVRCDRIANGIIEAAKIVNISVPVVVRFNGTNANVGTKILKDAKMKNLIAASSLSDGVAKVVEAANPKKRVK